MDREDFARIDNRLEEKKTPILQGSPGVGTFPRSYEFAVAHNQLGNNRFGFVRDKCA